MSPAASDRAASPALPRPVPLLVAAVLTFGTWFLIFPEARQLLLSQRAEYHFGDPPHALPLAAGALAVVGLFWTAWRVFRARPVSAWALGVAGGGMMLALASVGLGDLPKGRSWASADVAILETARSLQGSVAERLKVELQLPTDEAAWRKTLANVAKQPSPARTRSFDPVPYRVVLEREQGRVPEGLAPGTFVVWVNPARDAFEITPVGFGRDGSVGPLADEKGERVVLRAGTAPSAGMP